MIGCTNWARPGRTLKCAIESNRICERRKECWVASFAFLVPRAYRPPASSTWPVLRTFMQARPSTASSAIRSATATTSPRGSSGGTSCCRYLATGTPSCKTCRAPVPEKPRPSSTPWREGRYGHQRGVAGRDHGPASRSERRTEVRSLSRTDQKNSSAPRDLEDSWSKLANSLAGHEGRASRYRCCEPSSGGVGF